MTRDRVVDWLVPVAPAERLATLRLAVGAFTTVYLLIRAPIFLDLGDRPRSTFSPLGVWAWLDEPLPAGFVIGLFVVAVLSSIGSTVGVAYRVVGPLFGVSVLALLGYRSSWGQILWFEIPIVIFALIVGLAPAAESRRLGRWRPPISPPSIRYGWPVQLAAMAIIATYVIAGIAKLRYGGIEWAAFEPMRNQIAFTAVRLEIFGEPSSPLVRPILDMPALGSLAGVAVIAVELGAPLALLGGRLRTMWVAAVWLMHAFIAATMFIVFPLPLFGVAFLPLFDLERWTRRNAN
ncbi:MAG: HTTM domain-containing protein [Acidimicrobiales bacterium]